MDKISWKKTTLGTTLGAVLGSVIPAAATIYFWQPLSEKEETKEPESVREVDNSSKPKNFIRGQTYPGELYKKRDRDTQGDQLADIIMKYIEARKNEADDFPKYSEYVTENYSDAPKIPPEIYQQKYASEDKYISDLYHSFLYQNFHMVDTNLPLGSLDSEDNPLVRDFRIRMVSEITEGYKKYLDEIINSRKCAEEERFPFWGRTMHFSFFVGERRREEFSLNYNTRYLLDLKEKEKEACNICGYEC